MSKESICLKDLSGEELAALMAELGQPAYRAGQLEHWLYKELVGSYDQMGNLPKEMRQILEERARINCIEPLQGATSKDGTTKALFKLADGNTIETALMQHPAGRGKWRYTICVSTQAGCGIGCPFCATGQQGLERNLTCGEIVDQVIFFTRRIRENNADAVPNVVFMGMGEPLANYDTLMHAIDRFNSPDGLNIGARSMAVSTAGLVPGIERFSREKRQVRLAVSLHAADDALRDNLVPLNKRYPLRKLMAACRKYVDTTGRRITFEYILFAGLNDSARQAKELASLLDGLKCHVNLIAANSTDNKNFKSPAHTAVLAFQHELERHRIPCTLRVSKGADIDAGCGQLRSRFVKD